MKWILQVKRTSSFVFIFLLISQLGFQSKGDASLHSGSTTPFIVVIEEISNLPQAPEFREKVYRLAIKDTDTYNIKKFLRVIFYINMNYGELRGKIFGNSNEVFRNIAITLHNIKGNAELFIVEDFQKSEDDDNQDIPKNARIFIRNSDVESLQMYYVTDKLNLLRCFLAKLSPLLPFECRGIAKEEPSFVEWKRVTDDFWTYKTDREIGELGTLPEVYMDEKIKSILGPLYSDPNKEPVDGE